MPFSYILNDYQYIPRIINWNQVNRIIRLVRETKSDISSIWAAYMEHYQCSENGSLSTTDEEYTITKKRVDEARQKCIDYIAEIKLNYSTVYYLLKLLDEKAYRDISYTMFSILFGVPNKSFFRALRKRSDPVKELMLNKSGSIETVSYTHLSVEEQETHLYIDSRETWFADTTIRKDMTKFKKQGWEVVDVTCLTGTDSVVGMRFRAPRRCLLYTSRCV